MRALTLSFLCALGLLGAFSGCGGDADRASQSSGDGGGAASGEGDGDLPGDGDEGGSGDGDDAPGDGDLPGDGDGVGGDAGSGDGDGGTGTGGLSGDGDVGTGGLSGDGDGDSGSGGLAGDGGAMSGGVGGEPPASGTCTDGQLTDEETDVDCGGPDCEPCVPPAACLIDRDCIDFCREGACARTPYQQTATIHYDGLSELTQHQVRIELTPDNFDYEWVQADASDLRVSTNGSDFDADFFVESWNPAGTSVLWVKVPLIFAQGDTTIHILSGDTSLSSASDPLQTFEFYDDFEDGTWTDKWDDHAGALVVESGGVLTYEGDAGWAFLATQRSFTGAVAAYATMTQERFVSTDTSHSGLTVVDDDSSFRYVFNSGNGQVRTTSILGVPGSSTSTELDYPFVDPIYGQPHQASVSLRVGAAELQILDFCQAAQCAGSENLPQTFGQETFDGALRFGLTSVGDAYTLVVDDFFVVKATAGSLSAAVNE